MKPHQKSEMSNSKQVEVMWTRLWSNGRVHLYLITKWLHKKRRHVARLLFSGGLMLTLMQPVALQNAPTAVQNTAVQQALLDLGFGVAATHAAPATPFAETQVNSNTTGNQTLPSIAMDSDGDFVVVWQSPSSTGTDTDGLSIQGQRFNSAGSPQGAEFQINTTTTGNQGYQAVAMDSDGDFVVVWQSLNSTGTDTDDFSIQGQRFNSVGSPQGAEFQINTTTTGRQQLPAVAMDSDGDFVVAWESANSSGTDTDMYSVQGQRFNSAGGAQGSEFQVNTSTISEQRAPAVAMDSDGDFVVAWGSYSSSGTDTDGSSVQGQRFNSVGSPQGAEFQVNSTTTGFQRRPAAAMDSDGDFVVVWDSANSSGTDTDGSSVQGQRFNSAGSPQGAEFQINSSTTGNQGALGVAMDSDGDFVVAWDSVSSSGTDTDSESVQGQRFNSAGGVQGAEFQVNNTTTGSQRVAAVAMDNDGNFVVSWQSDSSADTDTDGSSIQMRGEEGPTAVTLQGTAAQSAADGTAATGMAGLLAGLTGLMLWRRRKRIE